MAREEWDSFFESVNSLYDDYEKAEPITFKVDMVNSPKHYILNDNLEVKDVRLALLQKLMNDGIVLPYEDAHDWITAWEYITRAPFKNKKEDLEKGVWYLQELINRMDNRGKYEHQP